MQYGNWRSPVQTGVTSSQNQKGVVPNPQPFVIQLVRGIDWYRGFIIPGTADPWSSFPCHGHDKRPVFVNNIDIRKPALLQPAELG